MGRVVWLVGAVLVAITVVLVTFSADCCVGDLLVPILQLQGPRVANVPDEVTSMIPPPYGLAWRKPTPRPNPVWDRLQDVELALRDNGSIWRTPGACDGRPLAAQGGGTVTWAQLQERLSSLDAFIDAHRKEVPQTWRLIPNKALKNSRDNGVLARAYKGSVKAWRIWQLISRDAGFDWRGFCEIGINFGHSAIMWLEANPDSCVYLWDLPDSLTQEPMMPFGIQYLKQVYSERVVIIQGDHATAIQDFHSKFPNVTCDVISIDGPKDGPHRELDYERFQLLANNRTVLLIDDTAPEEVTNFSLPSTELKSSTDRVTRKWVQSGQLEVLAVIPLSVATESADGIYPGPNPEIGHGTLVARYARRPR